MIKRLIFRLVRANKFINLFAKNYFKQKEIDKIKIVPFKYENNNFEMNIEHLGTPDHISVIRSTFFDRSYDISFCEQGKRIKKSYLNGGYINPLIIDLGAHIGISMLYFQTEFPKSDLVCIEPNDESYRILEKNKFNVNAEKVHTINSCIGASDSQNIPIFENGNGSWSVSEFNYTQQANPIGYTNKVSLQTILSKFNDNDYFILKVDIEGSEKELFTDRSCWDLINKFEVVIIELHDWMLPGQNTAKPVFEWAVNYNRDILISGVNVFYFKNEN